MGSDTARTPVPFLRQTGSKRGEKRLQQQQQQFLKSVVVIVLYNYTNFQCDVHLRPLKTQHVSPLSSNSEPAVFQITASLFTPMQSLS